MFWHPLRSNMVEFLPDNLARTLLSKVKALHDSRARTPQNKNTNSPGYCFIPADVKLFRF